MNGEPGGVRPLEVAKRFELSSGGVNFLALKEQGTQLSVLTRNLGTSNATTHLVILITDFAGSFNVFTPMSAEQVADLAEELAVDWWHYTLEDFVCFFQRAKDGRLRKVIETSETFFQNGERKVRKKISELGPLVVTNRVDRGVIMEMLAAYDRERLDAFYEHETRGHELSAKPLPPEYQNGPFTFADCIRVIRGEATVEEIIKSKNPQTVGDVTKLQEEEHRAKLILDQQVKVFVEDVLKLPDARNRYFQPFYKLHPDLVEAELKRQRKLKRDGNEQQQ